MPLAAGVRRGRHRRQFNGIQGGAGIVIGHHDEVQHGVVVHLDLELADSLELVPERSHDEHAQLLLGEGVERKQSRARQQRGVDLEGRVLRGGADQRHGPVLHVGQHRVLLPLVEAVYLVYEQGGLLVVELAPLLGFLDYSAQVGHAGADGADGGEV